MQKNMSCLSNVVIDAARRSRDGSLNRSRRAKAENDNYVQRNNEDHANDNMFASSPVHRRCSSTPETCTLSLWPTGIQLRHRSKSDSSNNKVDYAYTILRIVGMILFQCLKSIHVCVLTSNFGCNTVA